jgi:murein DD-endopeptidase MepM/ murein hydrolase activator NlpD
MHLIVVGKKNGSTLNLNVSTPAMLFLSAFFVGLFVFSYYAGVKSHARQAIIINSNDPEIIQPLNEAINLVIGSIYNDELQEQKAQLQLLKNQGQDNIDALTMTLAKFQAHLIRLDALGKRLTEVTNIGSQEFNFELEPSMGGADDGSSFNESVKYSDFIQRLDTISRDIDYKTEQMTLLEKLLVADYFLQSHTPAGNPVVKGWISSRYGKRKDPFTGRQAMHKGIDVAGKLGSDVVVTADGIVVKAEKTAGYGFLVEIDHGHGISTRYAHNKTVKVKAGDRVKQGQLIASMGSSGRSTGPHVHYEVLINGKHVNPHKYIITARRD